MPQVDVTVAVVVDPVLDVGRRQELGLPDLARIGADHVVQPQVAPLQDLERSQQLTLKQIAAPAVMRHGRKHPEHRQLAHVATAEVGFQSPDRDEDLRRHAELLFDPRQQRGMTHQHRLAALDAAGGDAGRGILLETLAEGAALAAVEVQHRLVKLHAAERLRNHALRDAVGRRLPRHRGHEGVEVATALRGESGCRCEGCGEKGGGEGDGEPEFHCNPFFLNRRRL